MQLSPANLNIASNGRTKSPGAPNTKARCPSLATQPVLTFLSADDILDTDDPSHITWLYEKALLRSQEFSIPGVTYSLTAGVVKNIIPAIASTNAIIAASCTNEAFKLLTSAAPSLGYPFPPGEHNNYMMYTGDSSVYTYTFSHLQKPDCPVCGNLAKTLHVEGKWTLAEFIEELKERPEAQLRNPSLRSESKSLFYPSPVGLYEQTRPNLKRKLAELLVDGEEVAVSDPAYQIDFKFKLSFR